MGTKITLSMLVPCMGVPMCVTLFTNPLLTDVKLISVFCCLNQLDILIDFIIIEDQESVVVEKDCVLITVPQGRGPATPWEPHWKALGWSGGPGEVELRARACVRVFVGRSG